MNNKEKIVSVCKIDDVLHVVTDNGKLLYQELGKIKSMCCYTGVSYYIDGDPTGKWIELEVIQK